MRRKRMKKVRRAIIIIILSLLAASLMNRFVYSKQDSSKKLNSKIYSYMRIENNQEKILKAAVELNRNSSSNACVYFVSEVLRKNYVKIPESVCQTSDLISNLIKSGWTKDYDYMDLKKGDIAFTTDEQGNKNGIPSHTFIFMGWVKEGSYDYAYICDNQAKDYHNKIYHIRNVKGKAYVNGSTKDAFSFFMKYEHE